MQKPVKIILGIDPGTLIMGHGVIAVNGHSMRLIEMSVLKLSGKKDNYQRLQMIHQQVVTLVQKYQPDELAIESPFFGKNIQSMLKLGRAQGVAIAAAMSAGLSVTEYSPKKIKQSITGNGNADKEQVWKMLEHLLTLETRPKHFDATDALAVAICHHFQTKAISVSAGKGFKDWNDFAKRNPARLKK